VLTYAQLSAPGTYTITSTNLPAGSIAGVQVNGYIFKNTALTSVSTLPTGTTATTPGSTSNPGGNAASPSPSPPAANSGISSGAKTGIGIAVALVAVAALLAAAYLLRRKRRAAAANRVMPADLSNVYHDAEHGGKLKPEKTVAAGPVELTVDERPLVRTMTILRTEQSWVDVSWRGLGDHFVIIGIKHGVWRQLFGAWWQKRCFIGV
jgi:hypothetical protein